MQPSRRGSSGRASIQCGGAFGDLTCGVDSCGACYIASVVAVAVNLLEGQLAAARGLVGRCRMPAVGAKEASEEAVAKRRLSRRGAPLWRC